MQNYSCLLHPKRQKNVESPQSCIFTNYQNRIRYSHIEKHSSRKLLPSRPSTQTPLLCVMHVSCFQKTCAWCGKAIEYSGHFGLGGLLKKSPTEHERRVGEIMRSVIISVKKVGF